MPMAVPISSREPKQIMNQSAAKPLKRTVVVESTNQKPRSTIRKQYEQINVSMHLGTKSRTTNISEPTTLRKSTVSNTPSSLNSFAARRYSTVKFGNDQIASILGYGNVEGLNHILFSVGQLCDVDLKVVFQKSTCYIHNLKGNDLLT
ncbi:hypothetical protein Tco_0227111 [Tanacetum coccineum]